MGGEGPEVFWWEWGEGLWGSFWAKLGFFCQLAETGAGWPLLATQLCSLLTWLPGDPDRKESTPFPICRWPCGGGHCGPWGWLTTGRAEVWLVHPGAQQPGSPNSSLAEGRFQHSLESLALSVTTCSDSWASDPGSSAFHPSLISPHNGYTPQPCGEGRWEHCSAPQNPLHQPTWFHSVPHSCLSTAQSETNHSGPWKTIKGKWGSVSPCDFGKVT